MDPLRNPYTPNAGATPPVIAGREGLESQFQVLLSRKARGRSEKSMIITGLRGVGKTVLLEQFRQTATSQDWVAVNREMVKHSEDDFRRTLTDVLRKALLALSPRDRWTTRLKDALAVLRSFSLSIDPEGKLTAGFDVGVQYGQADLGVLNQDVVDLFLAAGEAAKEQGRGIILLFDEIQFLSSPQLEALIMGLHATTQRSLPVILVGAGLPQIAAVAGDAKSYAERLFAFPQIVNLTVEQSHQALQEPAVQEGARWTDAALYLAYAQTEGYPYFLQELGYATWAIAHGEVITESDVSLALPSYESTLDSSFFRVRLERTTELQQAYLRAMAELGSAPQKAADVAALMGRQSNQVAPTRADLISMGLLYPPQQQHGYAAFTVPQFDRFMKRTIPEFTAPPIHRRHTGTNGR